MSVEVAAKATETSREVAERVAWPAVGKAAPAIQRQMVDEIEDELERVRRETWDAAANLVRYSFGWCSHDDPECTTSSKIVAALEAARETKG